MLGFPPETEEEMLETIAFACSSKLMMAGFLFVTPYRNTELYNMVRKADQCSDFEGHEACYSDAGVNVSAVSDERLRELGRSSYRRFYMNPVRMARIAWRIPHKLDMLRALRAQVRVKFF